MSRPKSVRQQSLEQRQHNIESNPCYSEQVLSLKCIEIHSSDSDQCLRQFENVKICKTFWYEIVKFRKQNHIFPHLPQLEDRIRLRNNYLKSGSYKAIIEDMKRENNIK